MKNAIFFVIFLANATFAMDGERGSAQRTIIMHVSTLRLNPQQETAVAPADGGDSRSCCSTLGNLIVNAPIAACYISAACAVTQYIQALDYLGNLINSDPKPKTE